MGADEDVDGAVLDAVDDPLLLALGDEAGEHLDRDREGGQAALEGAEVLLGEDRGRDQDRHLAAVLHRLERRPQRHLGLAVADVAADQPVHRAAAQHVGLDLLDRPRLVGRLGVREASSSSRCQVVSGVKAKPVADSRAA